MNITQPSELAVRAGGRNDWTPVNVLRDEINLRTLLGLLNYNRWLLVFPTVLFSLLAAFAALEMPDKYTSSTQVMLNAREANIVDIDSVISTPPGDPRVIEGEISVIRSNDILHQVLQRLDLYGNPEFSSQGDSPPNSPPTVSESGRLTPAQVESVNILREAVSVSQIGQSLIIAIAATSEDPVHAVEIANTIADVYIESRVKVKTEANQEAADWLAERAENLRTRLESSEAAVNAFKAEIIAREGRSDEVLKFQLEQTISKLVAARTARVEAETRLAEINRRVESDGLASVERLVSTPSITRIRDTIDDLTATRAELAAQYAPTNARFQNIDEQIQLLEERLNEEIRRTVDAIAGTAATELAREEEIRRNISTLEQEKSAQSTRGLEERQLEREAEADRRIYQTFLERLNELVQQTGLQPPDARIVSRAEQQQYPSEPNRTIIVLTAAVFGLLTGGAIIFLSEAFSSSFRTDVDITRRLGIRTPARIPRVGFRRLQPKTVLKAARDKPFGPLSQGVRELAVSLTGGTTDALRVVMITSANTRDGTTTLCLLLSQMLARTSRSVIVVDCNFSRPALAKIFNTENGPDLVDVLTDQAGLEEVIHRDPESDIEYIPLIDTKEYGPELLYSRSFEAMLTALKTRYDFVILDSSAMSVSPDACGMGRLVDLAIFSIRWHKTSEQIVESSISQLYRAGVMRLGAVLTQIQTARERKYRRRVYNFKES